jgi:hypothetical protein
MECVAIFLIILLTAMWFLAAATGRLTRRSRQRKLLMQLGKQFGGSYRPGGLFREPSLVLRYGETWAVMAASSSLGPFTESCLQVRIEWPYVGVLCEILSLREADRRHRYVPVWPAVDLRDEFASKFEVLGEDASEVTHLLTSGVRWNIERLAGVGPNQRLHVLIRDGRIIVQKPWTKPRADAVAQFLQGALELYDQCMLAKATGIQFLHTDEAQPLDHVTCKICGEEIQDQMVVCRRCKTPHHRDCWQYTGSCSVFGCRETTFVMPEAGKTG